MDYKYLSDGRKVVVIGNLNNKETIVQEIFISKSGDEIPGGERFVVKSLHDEPVMSYKDKQAIESEKREQESKRRVDVLQRAESQLIDKLKALKDAKEQGKEKSKMRFMQKYYHKGAFFQEAGDDEFATTEKAEIFNRDFNEATNAEKGVDRSAVPEAMKLRHGQFGKAGRSKWTHLSNEDTTFVNTEDVRLRNAQEALMKQKKLEEQASGGAGEDEEGGGGEDGVSAAHGAGGEGAAADGRDQGSGEEAGGGGSARHVFAAAGGQFERQQSPALEECALPIR